MSKCNESEVTQSYPTLWHPVDSSLPGSSIDGIFQVRILEWVVTSFSSAILKTTEWSLFVSKPFNIMVIPVYVPTSIDEEAEVEQFYEELQNRWELTSKKDILFIIGDWNAKVGRQEIRGVTGKFGLGVQNKAWQRLAEFCQENTLVITNTLFQQHKRRLYTWTSPDGQHWNQIAYILCNQRWRSSMQSAETRPRTDCD